MGTETDAVVVGAGFAGLYAVHKLRNDLGLDVQAFDAGGGPGGTWWWNRYPGARCDFESVHYSYSFSEELQREWEWTERYAAQPEILNYLEWVAERLDLTRSFRFDTRVTSLVWDDAARHWIVGADDGTTTTARFVVAGAGNVSIPKKPEFTGIDDFRGRVLQTSSWPADPVDLTGKRVGVIGTGSTGIQVITEVAEQASHLTVFQRTAQFAAPLGNHGIDPAQRRWLAEHHDEVRAGSRESFLGAPYERARPSARADSPEQRRQVFDEFYGKGGFRLVVSTYGDLLFNKESNDTIADYLRDRIRERVDDPATAELLCPTDHPYATKRPPFETGYFEVFNQDNVDLVDVRSAPIERLTERGVQTTANEYELDVVILATGFDVFTRPLLEMGIVGRDGIGLDQAWRNGPRTYLGLQAEGFPNLFTLGGPLSAVALFNNALALEDHVSWVAEAIEHVRATGATTIEPTTEAQEMWTSLATGMLDMTLLPQAESSWFMGGNIPGKPRAAYIFPSGAPLYRAIVGQVAARDYGGIAIDGASAPVPPMVRLDPAVAVVLAGMLNPDVKPLECCTVEEARALVESLAMLQLPGPDVTVQDLETPRGRMYGSTGAVEGDPRPVVLFFHGGGWMSGSVNVLDGSCRRIAADLDAIVVSVDYRLAPEHPFPAAHDDCFDAVSWARDHISEYGGDPGRIIVMGESSGANMAASAALRARDTGVRLAAQVLVYPSTEPDAATPSRGEFVDGPFLSVAAADLMWGAYLDGAEATPVAAPARAGELSGLAPALVLTVELDPVRDEGESYAQALADAGVLVEQHRLAGLIHGVFAMSAAVPRVEEMHTLINEFVGTTLSVTPSGV